METTNAMTSDFASRVMRNSYVRVLCGLLAAIAMTAVLRAQEQPAASPAKPPVTAPSDNGTAAQGATPQPGAKAPAPGAESKPPPEDAGADKTSAPAAPASSTP